MRSVLLLAAFASAVVAACSIVTDLSGLSGGAVTDGGTESGSPTDAPSGDGTVTTDAGTDASDAARLCSQPHEFCTDFDDGALADGWTSANVDPKGAIERSTARSASAPASFHATIARRAAGDIEYALLTKSLPGPWKRTVIDFDMLLEAPAWQADDINAAFLAVYFSDSSGPQASFYMPVGPGYAQVTGPSANLQLDPVPLGRFFHVHLDIVPGASVSAIIDGKSYSGSTAALSGTGTRTDLDLGITGYNAPVPEFSVYYDNVVVDRP
jgi:hypothetical protein